MSDKYFVSDHGSCEWNSYETFEEAKKEFDAAVEFYRKEAMSEGEWSDEATDVYMGKITHSVALEPDNDGNYYSVVITHEGQNDE